jgi:predicted transcriptional regulator
MELIPLLENIGLNEKEAKVYLALLQLGKATAYSVSAKSGLKKPTTYVILQQLIEKGFAHNIPRAKKQEFTAEAPEECLAIAKEKIKLAEKGLPELLAIKKEKRTKTNVSYFENLEGVRQAHDFLIKTMREKPLEKREYVGFFAHGEDADENQLKWFDYINEEHKKYKIRRRAITVYGPLIINKYLIPEFYDRYSVKIKALDPKKYFSNLEILSFDRYVLMYSQKYLQAVLIENPDAALVFRQMFAMIWDLVEKDRNKYLRFSSEDGKRHRFR